MHFKWPAPGARSDPSITLRGDSSITTIRDVAKQSRYSATTVSIVLNNAPLAKYISAETKNTIKKAAEQLHYQPNVCARFLRGTRTHSVGIMVFDLKDPYCTQILSGIERSLHRAGHVPITDIRSNRIIFQRSVERLMERQIEGLVTLIWKLSSARYSNSGRPQW
jgi:LacI family transcriptional regulator